MSSPIQTRRIDLYDGQIIFINGVEVYECGNYLGGGASGAVYQATDLSVLPHERLVAIKILNPIGFKLLSIDKVGSGIVLREGNGLSTAQKQGKAPMVQDNVWWLIDSQTRQIYAAYEDPSRGQLRELPLPKCVEIWGFNPFGKDIISIEMEEKLNMSSINVFALGQHFNLPVVASKYLKWLRSRQDFCREVNSMMQVGGGHRNIIALHEVLELVQDSKTTLFLVLELVTGGELFDRIKNGHGMSEDLARKYFCQLLSGISHCHAKGVCHRDLKPENLLLSDPSDTAILKIADFGLSAVVFMAEESDGESKREGRTNQNQQNLSHNVQSKQHMNSTSNQSGVPTTPTFRRLRSVVGSPHYVAPEITASESSGYDGRKVDMWSAGVILYGLLAGTLPFGRELTSCERYKRFKQWVVSDFMAYVRNGNKELTYPSWFFPSQFPTLARALVCHLLVPDPNERLSALQALKHPWCKASYEFVMGSEAHTHVQGYGQGQEHAQGYSQSGSLGVGYSSSVGVTAESSSCILTRSDAASAVHVSVSAAVSLHTQLSERVSSIGGGTGAGGGGSSSPKSLQVPATATASPGTNSSSSTGPGTGRLSSTESTANHPNTATRNVSPPPPPPPSSSSSSSSPTHTSGHLPPGRQRERDLSTVTQAAYPPPQAQSAQPSPVLGDWSQTALPQIPPHIRSRNVVTDVLPRQNERRTNSPNLDDNEAKERECVRLQQQLKADFERAAPLAHNAPDNDTNSDNNNNNDNNAQQNIPPPISSPSSTTATTSTTTTTTATAATSSTTR